MGENDPTDFRINVMGDVNREAVLSEVFAAAVEAGLRHGRELKRYHGFAGQVETWDDFEAVKGVKDVAQLTVARSVYVAQQ